MNIQDNRKLRKLVAFLLTILLYYLLHEGAHLIHALFVGSFKQINFIHMGVQIETYRERMSDLQTGIGCLAGPAVTILIGYMLFFHMQWLTRQKSLYFRAVAYYMTLLFMLNDPFYMSVLYPYVGGGDMNGIALLIPETVARCIFGAIFLVNIFLIIKYLVPAYRKAYAKSN